MASTFSRTTVRCWFGGSSLVFRVARGLLAVFLATVFADFVFHFIGVLLVVVLGCRQREAVPLGSEQPGSSRSHLRTGKWRYDSVGGRRPCARSTARARSPARPRTTS